MKRERAVQWAVGLGMASVLFVLIALLGDLQYAGNDDSVILRPFMGFGALEVPTYHMTLHPILTNPLRWLSLLFPKVAWFSWMQLFFLWFACALSVKSLIGCFQKRGLALGWGVLAGTVYLICFATVYCCHVTFTITAAILGASAVLQILSIDGAHYTDGQVIRAVLLALLPAVLAYGLRQVSALPILAFCGLAFAYVVLSSWSGKRGDRPALKPYWISLLSVAAAFALLIGGRALEIKIFGYAEDLRWQDASTAAMDYGNAASLPEALLEELGWSQAETALINEWYFMERNITAEALEKVAAYNAETDQRNAMEKLQSAVQVMGSLQKSDPIAWRSLWVLLAVALLCAAGLLMKRHGVLWQWLCLLLGFLLAAAALLYLGWRGRLPLRAALAAFLPFAALVFGLLPACLPLRPCAAGKAVLLLLTAGTLALSALYALPGIASLEKPTVSEENEASLLNPTMDLDELAAENPDILYIYDPTLAADYRMFPSTAYGTPHNVLFWGGWNARSPQYMEVLKAFGIDGNDMDATIFLREDVCLARGVLTPDPVSLIDYISELIGEEVQFMPDTDWGGVHTVVFYQ